MRLTKSHCFADHTKLNHKPAMTKTETRPYLYQRILLHITDNAKFLQIRNQIKLPIPAIILASGQKYSISNAFNIGRKMTFDLIFHTQANYQLHMKAKIRLFLDMQSQKFTFHAYFQIIYWSSLSHLGFIRATALKHPLFKMK